MGAHFMPGHKRIPITFTTMKLSDRELCTKGEDRCFYRHELAPGMGRINFFDNGGKTFEYICPCGCGYSNFIAIYLHGEQVHGWQWNGNHTKPTLQPSIQHRSKCAWHGYVNDGEFVWAQNPGAA